MEAQFKTIRDIVCEATGEEVLTLELLPFCICLPNEGHEPTLFTPHPGAEPIPIPPQDMKRTLTQQEAQKYLHSAHIPGIKIPWFRATTNHYIIEVGYHTTSKIDKVRVIRRDDSI